MSAAPVAPAVAAQVPVLSVAEAPLPQAPVPRGPVEAALLHQVLPQRAVPLARERPQAAHLVAEEVSVEAEVPVLLLSRQSFLAAMARSTR